MFKTFPEFSKLTLADRDAYNALIKDYPPISEFSFTTMMTWWNTLDTAAVSLLNDNLVISHWLPGDDKNSGLSLVGRKKIDESLCTLFDYLQQIGESPRLVHVPEFVVARMRYPELFRLIGERDYDEYIVPTSCLYPLSNATSPMRTRIKKFLNRFGEGTVIKELDLNIADNREEVLARCAEWSQDIMPKDPKVVSDSRRLVILNGPALGVRNICMFIRGRLSGHCLYELSQNKQYAIASYIESDSNYTGSLEYMFYICLKQLSETGVRYVNLDFDLGIDFYRTQHTSLGPTNFFRKYSIEPAKGMLRW